MRNMILLCSLFPLLGAGCTGEVPRPLPSTESVTVEYRDGAFVPAEIRVKSGGRIIFKNTGGRPVLVKSDIHPTHLICPFLNTNQPLLPGESVEVAAGAKERCPYHNHLSATEIGTVVVE